MSVMQPSLPFQLRQARGLAAAWPMPAPLPARRSGAHGRPLAGLALGQPRWSQAKARPWRGVMRDLTLGLALAMLVVEAILACAGV